MRDHVGEALTKILQRLRLYKTTPENGLAIYAGWNGDQFILEEIEPPKPLFTPTYRCSNTFYVQPIVRMLVDHAVTAVIAIDNTDCGLGIIDGDTWSCLETLTSGVGGKSGKGGSSQRRYERNREAELNGYYHRCAEHANNLFLNYEIDRVLLAGPAFTKEEFLKKDYLDYRIVSKVSKPYIGIEYAGLEGVVQVYNNFRNA